jgi:hypothetical protein
VDLLALLVLCRVVRNELHTCSVSQRGEGLLEVVVGRRDVHVHQRLGVACDKTRQDKTRCGRDREIELKEIRQRGGTQTDSGVFVQQRSVELEGGSACRLRIAAAAAAAAAEEGERDGG